MNIMYLPNLIFFQVNYLFLAVLCGPETKSSYLFLICTEITTYICNFHRIIDCL